MDVWQMVLYVVASLLALRTLFALATHHKRQYLLQLVAEEQERRLQKAAQAKAERKDEQDREAAA